eukprot:7153417-Ditylum_brightwellii.AAC.1
MPVSDHRDDISHGEDFNSIEEKLVACNSHNHPLYCKDNAAVYYCIEKTVWGTQYALSLKPYQQ